MPELKFMKTRPISERAGVKFSHPLCTEVFSEKRWNTGSQDLRLGGTKANGVQLLALGIFVKIREELLQFGFFLNLPAKFTPHLPDSIRRHIHVFS